MKVNGAWYMQGDETKIVIERDDGTLAAFYMAPTKEITEDDLLPYSGPDPRGGDDVPIYMYRFYGLVPNMLSPNDYARIWGRSVRRVCELCCAGRVKGAQLIGGRWLIPPGVECPAGKPGRKSPRRMRVKGKGA
jgi:hypothetical protein